MEMMGKKRNPESQTLYLIYKFFFFLSLGFLLAFHRELVCLSSMKNRLKLLQRISFLLFTVCSFVYFYRNAYTTERAGVKKNRKKE